MLNNPLFLQRLIAVPFLVLGAWCLLLPGMVEGLSLRPDHQINTQASRILMGCFGAQAMLSGVFAFFSRFTRTTFLAYGVALLPFFGFNYYFVFIEPIFTAWMALDFVANVAMLGLCWRGWQLSKPA